ncbi:MAG TPA: ATP-grasp domain-containing protein [Casimicrobiaceae bacterium]|nr:ATP-grasp domain-containing protein [Casimicrobiaceae bacterium]
MKDILVLFPNEWDLAELGSPRYKGRYRFRYEGFDLFRFPENLRLAAFDARRFIDRVVARYRNEHLDGVISNEEQWGALIAAVVTQRLGLPGADPRAILNAQHKFYARELLARAVPEASPRYSAFPYDIRRAEDMGLPFPCFVKPVKATYSILARRVDSFDDVRALMTFGPLESFILEKLIRPSEDLARDYGMHAATNSHNMIAEELLVGTQVTVEGVAVDGGVTIVGIVDAVMYPGTIAFQRFEYPSSVSSDVQARMADVATRAIRALGFAHGMFNVELFHDPATDRVTILEVNPRIAYQFADLYEKVDGYNTYDAVLALATGEAPSLLRGNGRYRNAASFVLRAFGRPRLKAFPDRKRIAALQRQYQDAKLMVYVKKGAQLDREVKWLGSYRYAVLNLGAMDVNQLVQRYHDVKGALAFEFA